MGHFNIWNNNRGFVQVKFYSAVFFLNYKIFYLFFSSLPFIEKFKNNQFKRFSKLTDEELDRKALMTFLPQKTGDDIRKIKAEEKEIHSSR